MYSGSDSTESQNYTQWAINPTNFQNSNEQVDWAALAQQWIIMKEAGPPIPEQPTTAPPPPIISKPTNEDLEEGGEVPMDVDDQKVESRIWKDQPAPLTWNWQQSPQWNCYSTWPIMSGVPPPGLSSKAPLLPTPVNFNQFGTSTTVENSVESALAGYKTAPSIEFPTAGYWTAAGTNKVIKPHNKRFSKVNVPIQPKAATVTLDAAKRKQLPAWIREGLEKMEREKQKVIDKERYKQEKLEFENKMKLSEKEAIEIIQETVNDQQKSKFESDEESSDGEARETKLTPEPAPLSQEDMMLKVRRTMTEILLKVTNREIQIVCKEELQRHFRKHRASDHRASAPCGANLSAKLGLGVYADSDSSTETSDDEDNNSNKDSDKDLKDSIKRRKVEFTKTEREIEERLADHEEKNQTQNSQRNLLNTDSQVDPKVRGRQIQTKSSNEGSPELKVSHASKNHKSDRSSSSESSSYNDRRSMKSSRDDISSSSSSSRSVKLKQSKSKRSRSLEKTPEIKKAKSSRTNNDYKSKYEIDTKTNFYRRRSRSSSRIKRSRSSSGKRDGYSTSSKSKYSRRSRSRSRSRRSDSVSSSKYKYRYTRSRSRSSKPKSQKYRRSRSRRSRSKSRSDRHRRSRSYSSSRGKRSYKH